MDKTGRTILSIFFIVAIFLIGAGTAYQCVASDTDFIKEKGFQETKAEIEKGIRKNFLWRYGWVNVNGLYHRLTGATIVRGGGGSGYDVYKLSNGQIMYNKKRKDISWQARQVVELRDQTEEMGIHFMYVQLPFKIKDDSFMPPGTTTGGNANGDQMVSLLRENDVDLIDIREEIEKAGFDWSSLFFKTDHHWKPRTAMWAGSIIMESLSDKYGYDVDPSHFDYDNSYTKETYENYMLGAVGRRVGAWYDGLDDIDIVNPVFDTKMTFWGKSDEGIDKRSGTFYDTVYYWDNLQNRSDFERNNYSTYIGKEFAINKLTNCLKKDGPRILMIRESFSCALEPFIGLDASEVIAIDLRRYHKSIKYTCEKYDPDVVMVVYNPSAFTKRQFRFFD